METPSSTTPIRLVLVDDHFIVRMGVAAALGLHGDLLIGMDEPTGYTSQQLMPPVSQPPFPPNYHLSDI